jgi:ribonuclease III
MIRSFFQRLRRKLFHQPVVSSIALIELQKKIGYTFKDQQILLKALKHRSYLVQSGEERNASNERLELLGDAVLGLIVTDYLYHEYPDETEGMLTNYKSLLVSGRLLSEFANDFNLGDFLLLNDSEERSGGRSRKSILADAVESLIAAIYLDGGLDMARQFVRTRITGRLDALLNDGRLRNNKSILQEHCQSLNWNGPSYQIEHESGPDHLKEFTVSVTINAKIVGVGKGSSKKRAEQNAAGEALRHFKLI